MGKSNRELQAPVQFLFTNLTSFKEGPPLCPMRLWVFRVLPLCLSQGALGRYDVGKSKCLLLCLGGTR